MEDSTEDELIDRIVEIFKKKIESKRSRVIWIPGVDGETTTLPGSQKQLIVKVLKQITDKDPFDYVIQITAQPPKETGSTYTHAKEQRTIAEKLGILDVEDGALQRLLESRDELDYYEYLDDHDRVEERGLSPKLAKKIYEKLRDKKYLLVFEHLDRPIDQTILTVEIGLPTPLPYNGCWWLISTLSDGICSASKYAADLVLYPYLKEEASMSDADLIVFDNEAQNEYGIYLLIKEAQDILSTIPLLSGREDKILFCLFYSFMFTAPRTQVQDDEYGIKEDELVRFWMEEGFITELTDTDTTSRLQQQQQQQGEGDYDYNASHLFDTGKTIIDKFITRSLLRRRHLFISPTNAIRSFCSKIRLYDLMDKCWLWQKSKVPSFQEWEGKERISLFQLKLTKFPLSPPRCTKLTTLILRGCSHMHNIPDDFFRDMPLLRILDLSYTDLTFVPSSVSYLHNLRLLTLRGCHKLTTLLPCSQPLSSSSSSSSSASLPSPEHHPLLNLHVLDVSCTNIVSLSTTLHMPNLTNLFLDGCTALFDPPPFLPSLNKLRLLRLTGTQITTFPESTFSCMEWLRVLDLSNNHRLVSLPRSLSKARLLEELHINSCKALMNIEAVDGAELKIFSLSSDNLTSLPEWFSRAKKLEKLHLKNCRAMEKINIANNASMRSFFLSGSPVVELSLRGCKSLETIELHDLDELEALDLSFTRISELPANIFNDLPKLRYFCMVAAKNLRRFPWHKIQHLPKEFIFDHCSCHVEELINGQIIRRRLDGDDKARAHIFVDDPRFFWSLKKKDCERLIGDQVRRNLLEFHVTICPCERRCNKEEAVPEASASCRFIQGRNFPYKDIYFKRSELNKREVEQHRPSGRLCRHLTMEGVDRLPGGRFPLLDMIESLSISEDRSVVSLSDMSRMNTLKECMLTQCHNMESVVVTNEEMQQKHLEILWVSGLGKLTTLFLSVDSGFWSTEFGSLKHVHIEHCPRLEKLFPNHYFLLPSLETLTIKFCDSLREITYKQYKYGSVPLYPRLHTLILLELPKLLHFYDGELEKEAVLPSLKRVHVRGCWRLRRLPLLVLEDDDDVVVEVSGEQKWWKKLTWDHYRDGNQLPTFKEDLIGGGTTDDHYSNHLPLPREGEVLVTGEMKWRLNRYSGYVKSRFSIRFKPQAKFYSWEPTIRGRSRRRRNRSSRLGRPLTIIH